MSNAHWAKLLDRGVLSVSGEDARTFLQGLVSNDVDKVASDQTVYAGFLTPQGKFLFDFHMIDQSGDICWRPRGTSCGLPPPAPHVQAPVESDLG